MQSSTADSIFGSLGSAVTSRWRWVLLAWLLLTIAIRLAAPSWNDVAYDGDFEYLPAEMSSVEGGRLLDEAFPGERSRSQIVLVLGRDTAPLTKTDKSLVWICSAGCIIGWAKSAGNARSSTGTSKGHQMDQARGRSGLTLARDAFDHSIAADEEFYELICRTGARGCADAV